MNIVGHELCGCGQLELAHVYRQLGGQCSACFHDGKMGPLREIEVAVLQQRVPVTLSRRVKPKKKSPLTAASRRRQRKAERCKRKALKRLRLLAPDLYDVLYADERIKAGLPPVGRRDGPTLAEVIETYQAAWVYAAAHGPVLTKEPHA